MERELAEERPEREDRGLAPHPPPGTWPEPVSGFGASSEDEEKDIPSSPEAIAFQAEGEPGPSDGLEHRPATVMRVRFTKRGHHYHCRVFTSPSFAKNGDLVFDETEWPDIPLLMRGAEFLEEVGQWP